jgi:hypothetical protein
MCKKFMWEFVRGKFGGRPPVGTLGFPLLYNTTILSTWICRLNNVSGMTR